MIIKSSSAPPAPTNAGAIQSTADAARTAALALFEGSKIDNSTAPVEQGDLEEKKVAASPEEETSPEEESDEPKEEEKPEVKVEAKPEKKEEGLPDPLKRSFDRLAIEKKELREMQAQLKDREAKVAKYELADKLAANGDALGLLAAYNVKYSTLVKQKIERGEPDAEEPAEADDNPLVAEVKQLREIVYGERQQRFEREMNGQINDFVKANATKYGNLAADPSLSKDVVRHLLEFTKQTGKPPGETLEESIQMAVEAVEEREEAAAQKYLKRKGLTGQKASSTVTEAPKSAVEPPASELGSRKTLTNSHASSPHGAGSTRPETPEDLRAKALKLLEAQG